MQNIEFENIEQVLQKEGELMTCVSGISMYPMVRTRRDMVIIKKVDRKLQKNDVPVYRLKSGKLVMHRILEVTDNGYIIRGDNLMNKEYNITDENIIGMLKAFYRNGKLIDCETSKGYRVYIFLNRISFPIRYLWKGITRPILAKIKRMLIKK